MTGFSLERMLTNRRSGISLAMATKDKLIRTIVREFQIAQETDWVPPPEGRVGRLVFPPLLPTGTELQLPATEKLLQAVAAYAELLIDADDVLKRSHGRSEWFEVVRRSFGEALYNVERAYTDDELVPELRTKVDAILTDQVASTRTDVDLILGCWVFEDSSVYPITIGPISFASRRGWLEQFHDDGRISQITFRRLKANGSGKRVRARSRRAMDGHYEKWIAETIGKCPVVCTVRTNGLSSKLVPEKGVRAARLAMTALSLMWDRPSRGLSWMHLRYDGPVYHRQYVIFRGSRVGSGSSLSHMPSGYNQGNVTEALERFQPYLNVLGEIISDYLVPHSEMARPTISNALFLSLWWYQQACREESDQIATTKFAASMDALAGGKGSGAILRLIRARLGCHADKVIMPDGRTTKQVVERIYNAGRSRLIHGNSQDFAQDWSGVRLNAETLGRHMLLEVCDWVTINRETDDLSALRRNG